MGVKDLSFCSYIGDIRNGDRNRRRSASRVPLIVAVVERPGSTEEILHTTGGSVFERRNLTVFATIGEAEEDGRQRIGEAEEAREKEIENR